MKAKSILKGALFFAEGIAAIGTLLEIGDTIAKGKKKLDERKKEKMIEVEAKEVVDEPETDETTEKEG